MELHFSRNSGNSARAVFGLFEAGATWEPHLVDVKSGENRGPAYLAVNPMGKVPTLTHGPLRLWESNAINWYAAEKHPDSGLLPTSPEGRAAVQRWLLFQTGHVSPACARVFVATNRRVQQFWGFTPDERNAETGRRELERFLPVLDTALIGRDWLEGVFSLADVAYVPHLFLLCEGGFDLGSYRHVDAWFERLCARPAWQRAHAMVFD